MRELCFRRKFIRLIVYCKINHILYVMETQDMQKFIVVQFTHFDWYMQL